MRFFPSLSFLPFTTIAFVSLVDFQIERKMTSQLSGIAGTESSKKTISLGRKEGRKEVGDCGMLLLSMNSPSLGMTLYISTPVPVPLY